MALDGAQLCGGPHDGERVVHPPAAPLPDDLAAISFDDGAQYARTSEELADEGSADTVVLFRYDPDGALAREAKLAYGCAAPVLLTLLLIVEARARAAYGSGSSLATTITHRSLRC